MSVMSKPSTGREPQFTQKKPDRLLSLDLLRGLTIGFMILVNNNGDGGHAYWVLNHAEWNGFTPTDLVFPTFLFLVGISTVLSTASRLALGATRRSLFLHTLRRAVILFLLGIVVNSFPFFHLHTMRFYGVLPRIAICYLIVATLYIFRPGWRSKAGLAIAALVGYWLLMRFVPVPGYGTPTHEIPILDRDANLAAWLDRHIFSASHLYEGTRDPEGLLSTLPALATTLLGLLTGVWLRTSHIGQVRPFLLDAPIVGHAQPHCLGGGRRIEQPADRGRAEDSGGHGGKVAPVVCHPRSGGVARCAPLRDGLPSMIPTPGTKCKRACVSSRKIKAAGPCARWPPNSDCPPARCMPCWFAAKLQPHRIRTFTFSPDPDFEAKLLDIVGLYLNPPENLWRYHPA
jgi:hypothetical protein